MHEDLSNRMQDVLLYGLRLRDRVAGGNRPNLAGEQAKLLEMLGPAGLPPPWGAVPHGSGVLFLGIRYALACWLDEIMLDAGWREWDANHLEFVLYQTNIRYQNFWDQARLAETGAAEALEAFFLCALLGFRGALGGQSDRLRDWVEATRSRVTRGLGRELPALPEQAPEKSVPLLLGIEAYRAMTRRVVGGVLASVLVAAFLVVVLLSFS